MANDMGWGDPGYNSMTVTYADGSPHPDQGWISTPTMDAMAANGLRFDRFYSASAVCSPTRASCLLGRNPFRAGVPIDTSGQLYKGPAFANYFQLRDIIAGRDDDFIRGYCEALIEYGLGRPTSIVDTDLVNEMMAAAKKQDSAAAAFIHALVQSEAFRRK